MKVLVATKATQGQRKNDFGNAEEGELVGFGSECDDEAVDGRCGCRRAMVGLGSRKATTTFMVVERPDLDLEGLITAVHQSLIAGGWTTAGDPEGLAWAKDDAKQLADLATYFPLGSILEKRGKNLQTRKVVVPA